MNSMLIQLLQNKRLLPQSKPMRWERKLGQRNLMDIQEVRRLEKKIFIIIGMSDNFL